jgi:hypothetical protein
LRKISFALVRRKKREIFALPNDANGGFGKFESREGVD